MAAAADPDSVPKIEHSPFGQALAERILTQGPMTVSDYMEACAVEYYASRSPFGKAGDFITSPELNPVFGETIGGWLADIWKQMGSPAEVRLVELGPGRGVLSRDMLRVFCQSGGSKVSVHLVENSRALRQVQRETLKDYSVTWYDRFEEVARGPMLLVANEFITALPVRQYVRHKGKWHERMVAYDAATGEFSYTLNDAPAEFTMPRGYRAPIDRDILEVNEAGNGVMAEIARGIGQYGGAALIIDYGYSTPEYSDTLQSYKRHKRVDILRNPGGQDVTANLDFTALCDAAAPFAVVHGPVTQGEFLTRLDIAGRVDAACQAEADGKKRGEMRLALRRLTNASDMGEKFKVVALTSGDGKLNPKGFYDGPDIPDDRS